jgi:methenyltetrahydromethanopterin cyclohydrolase
MAGGGVTDLGLNDAAVRIVRSMMEQAARLGLAVTTLGNGATVVDAGALVPGSLQGGLAFAEACLGGLGRVALTHVEFGDLWLPAVTVAADRPAVSCLGSQYAGWQIKAPEGAPPFFAMGSGPARALARREEIFEDIGYAETATSAVLLLEGNALPGDAVAADVAAKCGVSPDQLYVVIARTASLAGSVQISARVVETGMHKLHALGYDVGTVIAGTGTCPLAPIARSDTRAIGRTNDCVLYGGRAFFTVAADDAAIAAVIEQVPSSASKDYGTPFYDLFKRYDNDFYKIDPHLFSPAEVFINNVTSGTTFHAGRPNPDVLRASLLPPV